MNKSKLYFGFILVFLITFLSSAYATDKTNGIKKDSMILIENTITQNLIMQGQKGISPQYMVYDDRNKIFYIINLKNNSLDIIDFSIPDSLSFINKVDLSIYGKSPIAIAFYNNTVAITIDNEIVQDSGKVVFFNGKGDFLKAFSLAPYVKSVTFDKDGKKVYISNFYAAGYKINLIDISKGIENTTKADMITLTYEKEKAGDTFKLLDSKDFRTALIATCVVFLVLLFLFLIYKFIGKLNTSKRVKNALINKYNLEETPKSANDEVGDVYAAIAMALSLYQTKMHDEENMVITLEKVARMYSPWSSKIYGLRQIPRK